MPSPFDAVLEAPFGKLGVRVANGALRAHLEALAHMLSLWGQGQPVLLDTEQS